jgi:hypothetical protein
MAGVEFSLARCCDPTKSRFRECPARCRAPRAVDGSLAEMGKRTSVEQAERSGAAELISCSVPTSVPSREPVREVEGRLRHGRVAYGLLAIAAFTATWSGFSLGPLKVVDLLLALVAISALGGHRWSRVHFDSSNLSHRHTN